MQGLDINRNIGIENKWVVDREGEKGIEIGEDIKRYKVLVYKINKSLI